MMLAMRVIIKSACPLSDSFGREALQGVIFTPTTTCPFVLTHAFFKTQQYVLTACEGSASKISFESFFSLQQWLEKVFVIKLKCKTEVL